MCVISYMANTIAVCICKVVCHLEQVKMALLQVNM